MGERLGDVIRFGALIFLMVLIAAVFAGYSIQMALLGGMLAAVIVSSIAWPLFVLR